MLIIERGFVTLLWVSNSLLALVYVSAWGQSRLGGVQPHIVGASVATLLALFAQISTLFYFIGSGRWIKDQADQWVTRDKARAFRIWEIYQKANKLKAGPMPFATLGIFFGLFSFILGGALQVGAIPLWVHVTLASLLLFNNLIGHYFTLRALKKNVVFLDMTTHEIEIDSPA
ncbi:MAG: hypothetical protein ABIR96_02640 [Bdellovibrionota bacterium]